MDGHLSVNRGAAPGWQLYVDVDRHALGGELLGERVDRRLGAELVDVRGPRVGDDPTEVVDV